MQLVGFQPFRIEFEQQHSSLKSFSAFAFFSGGSLPSLPLSTFSSWSSWQSPWRRWRLEGQRKWKTGSHIKNFIRSNMGKTSWMMSEPTWWLLMRRWYLDIFPLLLWYLWTMCVLLSHFYQLILSITKEGHSWPFMTHTHTGVGKQRTRWRNVCEPTWAGQFTAQQSTIHNQQSTINSQQST